ncbi:hypothetical protein CYMTET_53602 [Cymbomonas tetramitiformis]|uniref:Uncharacterized protein n=1 Tax=Cymbomonas tetramitiformis TaxID=36881 RepID=A0AAE0EPJ7_9CHLO|nr:hypothetical protein CYMTET_53602 [Cymbomonas tetramitiformis]
MLPAASRGTHGGALGAEARYRREVLLRGPRTTPAAREGVGANPATVAGIFGAAGMREEVGHSLQAFMPVGLEPMRKMAAVFLTNNLNEQAVCAAMCAALSGSKDSSCGQGVLGGDWSDIDYSLGAPQQDALQRLGPSMHTPAAVILQPSSCSAIPAPSAIPSAGERCTLSASSRSPIYPVRRLKRGRVGFQVRAVAHSFWRGGLPPAFRMSVLGSIIKRRTATELQNAISRS